MEPLNQVFAEGRRAARSSEVSTFLWTTYRWMALGLALTGIVAFAVASSPAAVSVIFGNRFLPIVLFIAEIGLVISFMRVAVTSTARTAAAMFLGYAALNGVTFSAIFLLYTQQSIAQVFFVSAGSFAALSLYGAVTKRDLSP